MQRKDLAGFTADDARAATVLVRYISQYDRWSISVNGERVTVGDAAETLFPNLDRIAGWLRDAGFEAFTVETAINQN